MHDGVSHGGTEQNYDDEIADKAYGAAAANIVTRKHRKNTARMRGTQHRSSVMPMRSLGRGFKPAGFKKVADNLAEIRKKTGRM